MKNLKTSMKLIVSFLIVIVLAVLVGAMGVYGMSQLNTASAAMYDDYLTSIRLVDKLEADFITLRMELRQLVLYDAGSDTFQQALTTISDTDQDFQQSLQTYSFIMVAGDETTYYNTIKSGYDQYMQNVVNPIIQYGQQNNTTDSLDTLSQGQAVANSVTAALTDSGALNDQAAADADSANDTLYSKMVLIEVALLIAAVVIALLLVLYISGLIAKPLTALTTFMNKAGNTGDMELTREDQAVIGKYAQFKDEVGQSIAACAKFVSRLQEISGKLEILAAGDLTIELDTLSDRDTMGKAMNNMLDSLNGMFGEIQSATAQVSIGSKQIADGAQTLAQGSTEQASAVEQLSASIADIAEQTKQNAEMAGHAASLAENIKQNAEKGNLQMDQMMQAVREINDASQNISKVIKAIDDIAFQTNILALNAAVEAARAGQHGKGFAVVAEEVRNLAAKSAEAAKETGSLIANSIEKAEIGSHIANDTATSLVEIVAGINESSKIVENIAQQSNDQRVAITEINSGIDQVAQVIQQNSATAQESAAASQEMSGQASSLDSLINQFKLKNAPQRLNSAPRSPHNALPERSSFPQDPMDGGIGKY